MRSGSERSRSMRMTVRPCFASVTAREQPRMPAPTIIASGSCDMKTEIYVGVCLFREFVRPTKLQTTPQLRDDFRKKRELQIHHFNRDYCNGGSNFVPD